MIRKTFCALIIILGSGLDIYFYAFRFIGDGINLPIAIAMAFSLELLLAFSVWNMYASKWFLSVAIAVSFYAVIQTSAGQTFSLLSHETVKETVTDDLITEYKKNLERLDIEYGIISKQMQSVTTTEDRANYGRTVYSMQIRLEEISRERIKTIKSLSDISDKKDIKNMSVYDFYSSMPKWDGMQWLKFMFHTVLSILIALMTPIGILSWNRKEEIVKLKKMKISRQEVERFVKYAFYKITHNQGNQILSELSYNDWLQRDGHTIKLGVYPDLYDRCVSLKIINQDGSAIIKNEQEIVSRIMV